MESINDERRSKEETGLEKLNRVFCKKGTRKSAFTFWSYIESEMHNISILNDILLPFDVKQSGIFHRLFAS